MDDERPSVTAEGAAVMRALHQKLDDDPKILDDRLLLALSIHAAIFISPALSSSHACLCPLGYGSNQHS